MKVFFVVPHGIKDLGADPAMKPEGIAQIEALKSNLPDREFPQVWRGEGRRHGQVAQVLGLIPTHYSGLFGPASSVERRPTGAMTVLPDGSEYPFKPQDAQIFRASLIALIERDVVDGAIVCSGREMLMALTGKPASELLTGLYKVTVDSDAATCECLVQSPGNF